MFTNSLYSFKVSRLYSITRASVYGPARPKLCWIFWYAGFESPSGAPAANGQALGLNSATEVVVLVHSGPDGASGVPETPGINVLIGKLKLCVH